MFRVAVLLCVVVPAYLVGRVTADRSSFDVARSDPFEKTPAAVVEPSAEDAGSFAESVEADEIPPVGFDLNEMSGTDETVLGLVQSCQRTSVRAAASGHLKEMHVQPETIVTNGQEVAHIDNAEAASEIKRLYAKAKSIRHSIKEAAALYRAAVLDVERNKKLLPSRSIGKATYEEAVARAESLKEKTQALTQEYLAACHAAKRTRQSLSRYVVSAPFDGRVSQIDRYAGQFVAEGDVIAWIESHAKKIKVLLPGSLVKRLDSLIFSTEIDGRVVELPVYPSSPKVDPDGYYAVFLDVGTHGELLSGQIVELRVRDAQPSP